MKESRSTWEETRDQYHAETHRILEQASQRGITLRLLGSQAIREHCPKCGYLLDEMKREYVDLDFVGLGKDRRELKALIAEMGYEIDREMLVVAEGSRYLFNRRADGLVADIFIDELDFCHRIDLKDRLSLDYPTIPLADLLLSKLQIVDIADKDMKDIAVLLLEHELVEEDEKEGINAGYISDLLARDWGFYYTVQSNIKKLSTFLNSVPSCVNTSALSNRIAKLYARIESAPKTFMWKVRSKLGTRILWYKPVSRREHTFK